MTHSVAPDRPLLPPSTPREPPTAVALLWGVLLTLCVTGYTFGQSNHHVYLLDAIRSGHPERLARDWFVTHTLQYHVLFTLLTVGLQKVGLLTAGFFILYLGLVVAMHAAWLSIVRSIGGDLRAYFLSVLIYHLSGGGLGLGVYQILQDGSFLPSNVAAVACVAALAFWLRDRRWPTAVCVAVAGLFHVNYAMACIGAWGGLSLLAMVRARSVRPFLAPGVLAAAAVALVPCAYTMLIAAQAAREGDAELSTAEFVAVYVRLRHSHHHEPLAWPAALWISFLWPIPFALYALWRMPASRVRTGIGVVLLAILGVLSVALLFAGVWYVSGTLVKLSLFRFSPFAKLISCVLTGWLIARHWPATRRPLPIVYTIVGVGLLVTAGFRDRWPASVPQPSLGLLIGAGCLTLWLAWEAWLHADDRPQPLGSAVRLLGLPLALLILTPAVVSLAAQQRLGVTMPGEGDDEMAAVCAWAQANTDRDALFLVPPHDQSFTLAAQRAEVVSFKHVPQLSAELVEWKRRLDAVLDMNVVTLPTPMPRTMDAMAARYASLPPEHLFTTAATYDCDYVISMTPVVGRDAAYVSPGRRYFVYRCTSATPDA